jgi:hypothetical protein
MSLNDFETVPVVDADEVIITKIGGAVRAALAAKEDLTYAMSEAIDASTTFGYELGAEDMKMKLIQAFEAQDSACVTWALGVIEAALN